MGLAMLVAAEGGMLAVGRSPLLCSCDPSQALLQKQPWGLPQHPWRCQGGAGSPTHCLQQTEQPY